MAGLDYFTFVAATNPSLAYSGTPVEPTSTFTRTVASGSDWEVDATPYRLKYVGTRNKTFRINARFQQTSATSDFRPELSMYDFFPIENGNGGTIIVNGGSGGVGAGVIDQYPNGFFLIAVPNTTYGFSIRDRSNNVGTSTNWILTIFLNILR